MKQKSIEQFLGVHREDKYNGGQLIDVYREYLHTHEKFLFDLLILHNADDLRGMPSILPILNYADLFESDLPFAVISCIPTRTKPDIPIHLSIFCGKVLTASPFL